MGIDRRYVTINIQLNIRTGLSQFFKKCLKIERDEVVNS